MHLYISTALYKIAIETKETIHQPVLNHIPNKYEISEVVFGAFPNVRVNDVNFMYTKEYHDPQTYMLWLIA